MVSDRDRAIREEMYKEVLNQLAGLTVFFDDQGAIYRYSTIVSNIAFVRDRLNGDTANPESSL